MDRRAEGGLVGYPAVVASTADGADCRAGAADKDMTPPLGIPMWGYGARHDAPSEGTLDPLMAKAIVIAGALTRSRSSGLTSAADRPRP